MGNLVNTRNNEKEGFNPNVDNSAKKANASAGGRFFWYITWILIIPLIIHVTMRNNLMRSQTKINELSSGIDVQLKKRRDTLVKLLDATKGYMKYEKSLLTDITKLRKMNISPENRANVNGQTGSLLGRLIAVAENYPNLKANNSVQEMMEQASYIEREIGASRRLYNSEVQMFNSSLFMWPKNVPATGMNLSTYPYFKASLEDKKDVKISFD